PEVNPEVAARLREYGHEDFTSYVAWACERALERGLLPHTNLGVLSREDLARLREVTASQGLMLESISERSLTAIIRGRTVESFGDEIKAVTYHEAEIRREGDQWQTNLVFDV
ncbi:MAG: archease, partial [Acidobacteria bacterium]|nr:archease [Acidobacteriota bacterium]